MTGAVMDRARACLIAANGACFAVGLVWTWVDRRRRTS